MRVTPASSNLKPVAAPPSSPAKPAFRTQSCRWIASCETWPVVPAVITWNQTGTLARNDLPPLPCCEAGTST